MKNIPTFVKTFFLIVIDCMFSWLSWVGAVYFFTYLFVMGTSLLEVINSQIWIIVIASLVFYTLCGVYKTLWDHPGIGVLLRIITSAFLASFTVYVALRVDMGYWQNPGLGVMAFYLQLTLSLIPRMTGKVLKTIIGYLRRFAEISKYLPHEPIRTLLIGAGESASTLLLHPSQQGNRPRRILGILDNDTRKHKFILHGVPILGGDELIPQLVKKDDIEEIIIAVPSMSNEDLRRIIKLTPTRRCKVRVLKALSHDKSAEMLRDINIGDLLGRTESVLNTQALNHWLDKKTVIVTGGGGSIGSEICRQLLLLDIEKIVIFDISENNAYNLKEELKVNFGQAGRYKVAVRIGSVQDSLRLDDVFNEFKPAMVFHAAAYKHVPLMEECPRLAVENNVLGTYRAAQAAMKHGVKRFVMISTDKAVNPTNVMGASKRMAELITLGLNQPGSTEFVCVRFGNVLDSNGSVIPLFKRQIEAGGPVTVTHPQIIRYFMTISEASRLVLEAGVMAEGGEIFILDMGEQIKISDLAENLIRMAGLIPDVDIEIEYIGLRSGEKLFEELLLNTEGLIKTLNEKIFITKPEQLSEKHKELIRAVETEFTVETDVRSFLKRFVPEYREVKE